MRDDLETLSAAATETDAQMLTRLGVDAAAWAAEFRKTALVLGYSDMDEGWLVGWFANAMMAEYDALHRADHLLDLRGEAGRGLVKWARKGAARYPATADDDEHAALDLLRQLEADDAQPQPTVD